MDVDILYLIILKIRIQISRYHINTNKILNIYLILAKIILYSTSPMNRILKFYLILKVIFLQEITKSCKNYLSKSLEAGNLYLVPLT